MSETTQHRTDEPDLEEIKRDKTTEELLHFSILNIDKPSGPTSFRTAEIIKDMIGAKKMAHFGTLDPKVTGVLPVALNRACKLTSWFLKKDKTYEGVMRVHKRITAEELQEEMDKFTGVITQVPPVRSRVKRQPREREVYYWTLKDKTGKDVEFVSRVEAGTYIRKLIHDMGENIGGAHMRSLRRTEAGIFTADSDTFVTLEEFERAANKYKDGDDEELRRLLIPGEAIGCLLPMVQIRDDRLEHLFNGLPLLPEDPLEPFDFEPGTDVAVFAGNRFVEVAQAIDEEDEEAIAKPQFVFN